VFIDLKYIPCLKDDIPFLTASYKCVASPISDHKQVAALYKAGFHHFCGNFVEKPKEISNTAISPNKTAILNLLATLSDPDVELHKVNKLLVADPVLSYKILKIVNSPIYRGTTEIQSVQDAVVRFGLQNLKKWVYMLSLCLLNDQNPTLLKLCKSNLEMSGFSKIEMSCLLHLKSPQNTNQGDSNGDRVFSHESKRVRAIKSYR
jgi:c-di-GMP-related signal transduction protein